MDFILNNKNEQMYKSSVKLRVRYGETDQMGYVYYGNYAQYFEVGRVEALREMGISYKELEESGTLLPVSEFEIKYFKPAFYDDEIEIRTTITSIKGARMMFSYETLNQNEEVLNHAKTTLVFMDRETGRPSRCPQIIEDRIKPK